MKLKSAIVVPAGALKVVVPAAPSGMGLVPGPTPLPISVPAVGHTVSAEMPLAVVPAKDLLSHTVPLLSQANTLTVPARAAGAIAAQSPRAMQTMSRARVMFVRFIPGSAAKLRA